jgi:hypothetical protein
MPKTKAASKWKSFRLWIIILPLIGILVVIISALTNHPAIQILELSAALQLPKTVVDCHDPVPQGPHDFENKTLGKNLHWTGCVTYVHGQFGAAEHETLPNGNLLINRVFIPVDVNTAQQQAIWDKEVVGNAYAILFGPNVSESTTVLADGLAAIALSPADQQALQLNYPSRNKVFRGQYVQWQPLDAKTATIDCTVFLAVHYTSLQGSLNKNNQGIADLFQKGKPFEKCLPLLQNP